jgi:transcriptional regulator with XRE-family HTH domain
MKENSEKGEFLRTLASLNIKRFRVNSGLTQEELAEKAGISVPYLGALERGENGQALAPSPELPKGWG